MPFAPFQFRCALVGDADLTAQCGQAILDRGGHVACLATTHAAARAWAVARDVPTFASIADARAAAGPVDYLFSVVNGRVLDPDALAWPTLRAINYHNGPLPRYAGVHATSWAILHGEREHGIAWHAMEPRIDTGAILRAATFPIDPHDTAFDLNVRCHEHALVEFGRLFDDLAADRIVATPQDASQRTYFGATRKDADAGLLRWDRPAEHLDRVVRAHTLGPLVANTFGLPKLLLADGVAIAEKLDVLPGHASHPPGTVVSIETNGIVVTTATQDVRIRPAPPGVKVADRLPVPDDHTVADFSARLTDAAKDEAFCAAAIASATPAEPPYASPQPSREPASFEWRPASATADALWLAIFVWLGRSSVEPTSVRCSTDATLARAAGCPLLVGSVPLTVRLAPDALVRDAAVALAVARAESGRRGVHAADLAIRYRLPATAEALPVALHAGDAPPPPARLAIAASADGTRVRLASAPDAAGEAYAAADLAVIAGQIGDALRAVAASPDAPLESLDLLSPTDRATVNAFNRDDGPASPDSIVDRWDAQARRTPDATALVMGDRSMTYGELDARAEALADRLTAAGVGVGTLVGTCVERSFDAIVAIVAVLKAGGAYVPIAADLPAARRGQMLADASIRHVVAPAEHDSLFAGLATVIALDAATKAPRREPVRTAAGDVAYVNFTSGSTGVPKGVLIPHRGVVRLVDSPDSAPAAGAVVLHAAPLSFDAATWEIWGALLNGGTLVLLPPGPPTSATLRDTIRHGRVDTLFLTTALFNRIVDRAIDAFVGCRHVVTGGEAMSAAHARRFLDAHARCRLTNAYGPTENTSFSTVQPVAPDFDASRPVPIGRPIWHSQAHVLDAARRPLPVGTTGELYVAGAGLAIGYLNRPDLTTERFVTVDGRRMYRTGDLARWNADGSLDFLGRADRQVKLRGHRIEPGEIEAAIHACDDVDAAAVVVRDDAPGGRGLIAYVVPRAGVAVDTAALRRAIAGCLPDYMVPAAWVILPALPLSPTGKLNRAALPAPAASPAVHGRPPRTPVERTLCELFACALSLPSVGLDDDFFALGGHSLRAAELAAQARDALGADLPLRLLFEHPTVAGLLAHLPVAAPTPTPRPTLARRERPDPMPLSPTQRRLWFLQQLGGPSPTYNLSLAHRLDGPLDVNALRDALADVAARHESLRTIFPSRDGVPFQRVLPPDQSRPPLVVESCDEATLHDRLRVATTVSLDLARQPPLHAWLFALAPDRHVLLIVLHHVAGDGWSLRPLFEDLSRAYTARARGATPAFEPLPIQYADYTLWHRDRLGDAADPASLAARQLAFWRSVLADAPPHATLRTDHPRPAVARQRGAAEPVRIDAALHARLSSLAREAGASLFMVLEAALAATLSRMLGAGDDVLIGCPVAGRGERLLDDQIGFYANTLALRIRLHGRPAFRELIGRAKRSALDAFTHAGVPFDEVVRAVLASRSAAHHPLFQVMFALNNTPPARPTLAGLNVRPEPVPATSAKLDLLLALTEHSPIEGRPAGVFGEFEYDRDLFEPETVRQFAAGFIALLEAAVARPDRPMEELTMHDDPTTIPALLHAASKQHGDRPALLAEGRATLSHAALGAQINALAGELRAIGLARGDRVAIVLPNGPGMAVTFLAVVHACAAAPLNPAYRAQEFEFYLDDLNARALIVADGATGLAVDVATARGLPIVRLADADGRYRFVGDRVGPATSDAPPSPADVALLLHTSGTTARPKLVPLSHANLCASARNVAASLALTPDDRCLNVMPLFHIHGLVAALLSSLAAGAAIACSSGFDATKVLGWLRAFRPTWYTAVPTMHAAILDRARAEPDPRAIAPLRLIRSSSSAMPPTVAAGLEQVFGVPVIEAYGMTEAAHQMCCNPLPPRARKPGSVGVPAGPEVAVMDAAGNLVPQGASGEVVIRGRNVTGGYAANDKANAEAFTNGWFRTGDLGHVDADGYLFLSGRSKEIINRGGEKISPREIDEALLEHAQIAAAVAFAVPDPRLGEEVAAAVVLRPGATIGDRDVMTFAAGKLADFKVPRRVIVLDELPKGPTGKVQRVGLAKQLGITGVGPSVAPAAAYVAPATDAERRLAAIWGEVLGRDRVGAHDRFFDLGGDSILAAQVIARARDAGLGELPIVAFFDAPTVAAMAGSLGSVPSINASLPKADESNLERLLDEIEGLTDEEAERLLAAEESARDGTRG